MTDAEIDALRWIDVNGKVVHMPGWELSPWTSRGQERLTQVCRRHFTLWAGPSQAIPDFTSGRPVGEPITIFEDRLSR